MKKNQFSFIVSVAFFLAASTAYALDLDEIVLLHAGGDNGHISILDEDTLNVDSSIGGMGFGAFTGSQLVVQSDNHIVSVVNHTGGTNADFSRRAASNLAVQTTPSNGFGAPISTLMAYNNGQGFQDYVFFGANDITSTFSNLQLRTPDLTGIASVGNDGINGGPSDINDPPNGPVGPIRGAVMNSSGALIHLWENISFGPGQLGRIRRNPTGDLAVGAGDTPFGIDSGTLNDIYGVGLEIRSDDLLVVAKDNRIVELRTSDANLSPDVGGFEVNTGQYIGGQGVADGKLPDDVTAMGVLSDDRFVVGLANGDIGLWSVDLGAVGLKITRDQNTTLACPSGNCTISAIGVQSDNDIIVGTEEGRLFRLDTTLSNIITPIDGFGRIDDIDFLNDTGGGTPGDFDGDGDIDGDDFLEWQRVDGTPAGLTEWQNNYPTVVLAAGVGAVPEPTAAFLLCAGMTILVTMRGRRFQ